MTVCICVCCTPRWLHADASLINMNVQFSLLQQVSKDVLVRSNTDKKALTAERTTAAARLIECEARMAEVERERDELRAALHAKEGEVGGLTMALQQAILEQKGVAESQQKWKK